MAIANPQTAETIIKVGTKLSQALNGELFLLHVPRLAPQTPFTGAEQVLKGIYEAVNSSSSLATRLGGDPDASVRLAHEPFEGIIHTVEEYEVDFVVMGWRGRSRFFTTQIGKNIDQVMKQTGCHVLAVQQNVSLPAKRILIPVSNPRRANKLLGIGRLLIDEKDSKRSITLLHVLPPGLSSQDKAEKLEQLKKGILKPTFYDSPDHKLSLEGNSIHFVTEESHDILSPVIQKTKEADLLLIGSSEERWWRRSIFHETPSDIAKRSRCPVMMGNSQTNPVKFGVQKFFQFFRDVEEEKS